MSYPGKTVKFVLVPYQEDKPKIIEEKLKSIAEPIEAKKKKQKSGKWIQPMS